MEAPNFGFDDSSRLVCWAGRSWKRIKQNKLALQDNDFGNSPNLIGAQELSPLRAAKQLVGSTATTNDDSKLKIRLVSYHALADSKCKNFNYTPSKYWDGRAALLISEIISYDADILLLQDIDHYEDMWQPKLMLLGYDSVFQLRTQTRDTYEEGCVIAYKRAKYQLFKTIAIHFNHSVDDEMDLKTTFVEKCKTDDVGIIAFLQPFASNPFPSAICVVSAMLPDRDGYADVRSMHAKYICKQVEKANAEFHVPVVVGLSMNDVPFSPAYHVMTSGRIPLSTQPPRKCSAPTGVPICRGSVKLKWFPPKMGLGEPQINYFRISWRPGGSLPLGFKSMIQVVANDCTQFEERLNLNGELRAVPMTELAFTVTGLSSDTPYEFKVAAVSDLGEGEWSDVSLPIVLQNPSSAPAQLPSKYLLNKEGVLEQSERIRMKDNDIDVETILSSQGHVSATQLTPRLVDGRKNNEISVGRLLPVSVNPRDGWKAGLRGGFSTAIEAELGTKEALQKTIIRTKDGKYVPAVADTPSGKLGDLRLPLEYFSFNNDIKALEWSDNEDENADGVTEKENEGTLLLQNSSAETETKLATSSSYVNSTEVPVETLENANDSAKKKSSIVASSYESETNPAQQNIEQPVNEDDESDFGDSDLEDETLESSTTIESLVVDQPTVTVEDARKTWNELVDDDVIVDCRSIVPTLGKPNPRQLHNLRLRSAYEYYGSGGEPSFTTSRPSDFGSNACACLDYIFYSGASFSVNTVLLLPPMGELNGGQDIRETITTTSTFLYRPLPFLASVYDAQVALLEQVALHGGGAGGPKHTHDSMGSASRLSASHRQASAKSKSPAGSARRGSALRAGSAKKTFTYHSSMHKQPMSINSAEFKQRLRLKLDESILASSLVKDKFFGGVYLPDSMSNPARKQFWLPNETFASSHFCMGVELVLRQDLIATNWST